jgi:hypothetical protein
LSTSQTATIWAFSDLRNWGIFGFTVCLPIPITATLILLAGALLLSREEGTIVGMANAPIVPTEVLFMKSLLLIRIAEDYLVSIIVFNILSLLNKDKALLLFAKAVGRKTI